MTRAAAILLPLGAALAACGPGLAARYAAGNQALSSGDGPAYFVVLGPLLQRELNRCMPPGTGGPPLLVLVADVQADGTATSVDVEPDSRGAECLRRALAETRLPRPPLAPGSDTFPIGLRIDAR